MSDPQEIAYALNRVDRSKTIVLTAIAFLFVVVLFTFGFVLIHARMDDDGRSKMLFMATASELAFIGACAALVAFHVTRMAKTVLNAIDLASRK